LALQAVGLVDAHDRDRAFLPLGICISDRGAKKSLICAVVQGGIGNFGDLQSFRQKPNATIDLSQSLFTVEIVSIL